MAVKSGRVVKTPDDKMPYKVVLEHEQEEGQDKRSEHPVSTVKEGEALIKEKSVTPPERPKSDGWHL